METTAAKERIESELTIAHDIQMGLLNRGIPGTSLFFTIANLVMIVVRLLDGGLFDRCNKVLLCAGGLVTAAACYALLPFCVSGRSFLALAGIFGLGWGIAMPLQAAVMFDISPPSARAMNQNLMVVMMQGEFFIGPFLGGQLISRFGYALLFTSLAATALVAGLMAAALLPMKRAQQKS
jgi:MFS family permease